MPLSQDELKLRHELKTQFRGSEEEEGANPFADLGSDGSSGRALVSTSSLVPTARPARRGLDLLLGAEIYSWAVSGNRKGKRKREHGKIGVDVESKGKVKEEPMLVDGQEDAGPSSSRLPTYPEDQIVRASKRLATEASGCSIGIGHWNERLLFELRGKQLCELRQGHKM